MAFFTSSNPGFFKIILNHTLVQGKLELPKKFVINNGGGGSLLHRSATLRLPCGSNWEVEMEKSGHEVSFAKGWPEFVKFYSVKVGYFVVFSFDRNSCFDVRIFDLSATEIDYPIKSQAFRRIPKNNNGGFGGVASDLNLKIESDESEQETGSLRKMKKKKKNKKQLTVAQRFSDEDEDEDLEMDFTMRQSNVKGSESYHEDDPESMRPMKPRKTRPPLTKNQEEIMRIASLFKCNTKNPSFMVTMRPSYIQTGCYLSLPRNFSEKYVKESMDVKLELEDGRVWSVWCGVRWACMRRRTEFKGGWKAFAVDNELKEGDSCVFELISRTPIVFFKVTIFHRPLN